MKRLLHSEADTAQLAQQLAPLLCAGDVVYLEGELGAGKTTLTRHLAHALGVTGRVKSPTYTLVETYDLPNGLTLHHFDLYRLAEPREWFSAGFDEYLNERSIALIEWPSQAAGALPAASVQVTLHYGAVDGSREVTIQSARPELVALMSMPS
ncbi:MAG: tRNA (adenosine(37)-N6)-threonylcarbamoyltransferase complex ATPase subunit type 1 TsaE [Formosimonas sp.]